MHATGIVLRTALPITYYMLTDDRMPTSGRRSF